MTRNQPAPTILFVCTGNTCRSAMAEAFARRLGVVATSAGVAALAGEPATPRTIEVMAEIGVDLGPHRATPLAAVTVLPEKIYVMAGGHADRIRREYPELAELVELLDPAGEIDDPWQGDIDLYRQTRDRIERAVEGRLGTRG